MRTYDAGQQHHGVACKQLVPESLLAATHGPRVSPVWIGDRCQVDHMHTRWLSDLDLQQRMWNRVEGVETFVNSDLHNGCGRIQRCVDHAATD